MYRRILGPVYDNEKENWRILTNKEIYARVKKPTVIETISFFFSFGVRHPCCVGSITANFLCITHAVKHNYISPSSTVGIQLMFQPYMWAIFRLWFNLQSSYTRCVGCSFRVLGVGWGEWDLVSIVGAMTLGCYKWINMSCLCTYVKVGYYSYAKDMLQR